MTRTLKLLLVLTLVIGTFNVIQITDHTSFVVSAEGELTWDQLNATMNATISELKIYINSLFENYTNEIKAYINDRIDINTSGENTSITYIVDFNDTALLEKLDKINNKLGGYDNDSSVYDDLTSVILGITYKLNGKTKYVLRDDTDHSIFETVFNNQVGLSENQGQLVNKISSEHNTTRAFVEGQHNITRSKISRTEKSIIASAGDGWYSAIACIGIVFLLVWIFYLKPKLNRQRYREDYEDRPPENNHNPIRANPNQSGGRGLVSGLKERNPFRIKSVKASEIPPDCCKDGVSYDPANELACNTCAYAGDCSKEKMRVQAQREIERERDELRKQKTGLIISANDVRNNTSLNFDVDGETANMDLNPDNW